MARRRAPSRFRTVATLAALLAGAALLRLDGIRYGLPFPLLNPDEASIVPRAWTIVHGGGLDPGWYDYPSLVMYLLAPFQAWQDEPSYLAGRLVIAAVGVAGVAAAWWLGRQAYGVRAGWLAAAATAVATTHVAYSRTAVTDVPLTLGVTAALALMVAGRLEWAGAAVGLAGSAKYPGLLLAAPLVAAAWLQWRRLLFAAVLAVAAFALTSPFVVAHPAEALDDIRRVQGYAREGWLGFENDLPTPLAFLDRLWDALGPAALVTIAGLVLALERRRRSDVVLITFVLVYFAHLLTLDAHFDRYVLPLVPAVAVLAARVRELVPVALVALVLPLAWTLGDNAQLRKRDTRLEAQAWIERNVPTGSRIAAESSTLPLAGYRVTRLDLPGPGRPADADRDVARLRADGIDYVLVSGVVADRVLAARAEYPRETEFYDELRAGTKRLYYLEPSDEFGGPWIAVYRL